MTDIIMEGKDIKEVGGLFGEIWSTCGQGINFT
jgi:hypothetical protein